MKEKLSKMERDYDEKYGDIPISKEERLDYLISNFKIKQYEDLINNEVNRIKSIKWKKMSFVFYLEPKATPRPRLGINKTFYVKGAAENKNFFKKFINGKDIKLITTPTKFYCKSYLPIPKSMKLVEKVCAELGYIYPTSKPDFDNLIKAYCDMVQGTLLYDDSLVIKGISEKCYSIKPRIEITIEYMEDYDSNFNKNKIIRKVE